MYVYMYIYETIHTHNTLFTADRLHKTLIQKVKKYF